MIKKNRIFIITVISAALFISSLVALAGRSKDNQQNPRKVDDALLAKQIDDEFLAPLSEKERANLHTLLLRLAEKHEPRCALASPPSS